MKRLLAHPTIGLLTFGLILFACSFIHAQNVRYSVPFPSISSTTVTPYLVANIPPSSPVLAVCNSPANQVPCTNYATTYTSSGSACPNGSQDTPDPQPSACQATGDAQGNIGFWAPPGKYDYTVCIQNSASCFGPYTVTLGTISSGGGGGSGLPLPNVSRFSLLEAGSVAAAYPVLIFNDVVIGYCDLSVGTLNSPTSTEGISITFPNSTSSCQGIEEIGTNSALPSRGITFLATIKLSGAGAHFSVGMSSLNFESLVFNSTVTDPTTVDSMVIASTGAANFKLIVTTAGTATTVDTGVAIDANRHKVQLSLTSGVVTLTLDGNVVATSTTHVPTSALGAVWYLPEGSGTFTSDFEYAYWSNPTP